MAVENWVTIQQMVPKKWTCGHCGVSVGGNRGYYRNDGGMMRQGVPGHMPGQPVPADIVTENIPRILICPACDRPTYFERDKQVPGMSYGATIEHLPAEVDSIYSEARNCMTVGSCTGAVMLCRVILSHVAVEKGAKTGDSFQSHVQHLIDTHVITPQFQSWVDTIRLRGNDANHKLAVMAPKDAMNILSFAEMLLKVVYEYPTKAASPPG